MVFGYEIISHLRPVKILHTFTDPMSKHTILSEINIEDVVGSRVSLTRTGTELLGCCPFHDDAKKSLNVNKRKQLYFCGPCGIGGDAIDFLMRYGLTFKEALTELKQLTGNVGEAIQNTPKKRAPVIKWTSAVPDSLCGEITHYRHGSPSRVWPYRNADGIITGYACRFDFENGEKDVLPYTFKTDDKRYEWRWEGFDTPRPLYNLDLLTAHPHKPVVVVEGEKTADAVNAALDTVVAVTWMGGSGGVNHADFSPLENRTRIFWPDNDEPGHAAMIKIGLKTGTGKYIRNTEMPPKWDAADKEWQPGEMADFMRSHWGAFPEPNEAGVYDLGKQYLTNEGGAWVLRKHPVPEPEPLPGPEPEPEPIPEPEPMETVFEDFSEPEPAVINQPLAKRSGMDMPDQPFKFLGFEKFEDKLHFVFFIENNNQVVKYSAASLSKNSMLTLAPINWWEIHFPKKQGFDLDGAVNWIIQAASFAGVYEPDRTRGLGAWMENGKPVIHAGSHLVVEGVETDFKSHQSKYIYEAKRRLEFDIKNPIESAKSAKLIEMLQLIKWERDVSAQLLAGWCVVAPICGALKWRPHVWITGGAGTGKSWLIQTVVRKLLGNAGLAVQGDTTEAGIRQYLSTDARPIVFDEAEGEDRKSVERIQNVLNLMRGASTDDGGSIIKGSAGGKSQEFIIRSCFAFASIGIQVSQQSDRSRVTVLGIKNEVNERKRAETWKNIQKMATMLTHDYCAGIRARTIALMPVIIKNAETFAEAAAIELGSQRLGDQLGALLAGAYSLTSKNYISLQKAGEWIRAKGVQWDEERGLDQTKDELQLLDLLMSSLTRLDMPGGSSAERSIGELVQIAAYTLNDDRVHGDDAALRLGRLGFKIVDEYIVVSNSSKWIKDILAGTAWSKNHGKVLMRIEGAKSFEGIRFGGGLAGRGVGVPALLIC